MTAPLRVLSVASDGVMACVLFILAVLLVSLVTQAQRQTRCHALGCVIVFLLLRVMAHVVAVAQLWTPLPLLYASLSASSAGASIVMIVELWHWIAYVRRMVEDDYQRADRSTVREILDRLQTAAHRHLPPQRSDGDS